MDSLTKKSPEIAALLRNTLHRNNQRILTMIRISQEIPKEPSRIIEMYQQIPRPIQKGPWYVTISLKNGLCNRIFMILAGLGYAEKHSKQFVICKSLIRDGPKPHEINLDTMLRQIFPAIPVIESIDFLHDTFKESVQFTYNELPSSNKGVILDGYFQNEQYFPSNAFIPCIKTSYYPDTYFVHIRAGDYLKCGSFGHNLVDYYKKCFSMLDSNIKYIVFSDDTIYAETYMKQFNVNYTISPTVNQLDALKEMANCAGGICANSTFSWLGAFFQQETRGKIFMPSKWIQGKECNGVYPEFATIL